MIQSIIFLKKYWTPSKASEWLNIHNYKNNKLDITSNYLRYRQKNPELLKKKGYNFFNKNIGKSRIQLIIAYHPQIKGGKISINKIKKFIDNSYKINPDEHIDGYELDKDLTNEYAKIYYNKDKNHATITHKGTEGIQDWINNIIYPLGLYKYTDRYKKAQETQNKTNQKYGTQNVSTLGHSQGAILSRKLGSDTKEIINVNPAYINEKPQKNEYNIKSSGDIVSMLKPIHKKDILIKQESYNPFTEHSVNVLDRLNQQLMVGTD